jgi:hypothetical protein
MAELKTKLTKASVSKFIETVDDEQKKKDGKELLKMFGRVTGEKPEMWGSSIIGFGRYTYIGSDGKPKEWLAIGFSPRKQNLTIYVHDPAKALLTKLGKHKLGGGCLYINRLSDIDMKVLERIVKEGYKAKVGKLIDYRKLKRPTK